MNAMKCTLTILFLLLSALSLQAAPVDDMIQQAQAEYARGNLTAAVKLLGSAYAANPTAAAQKNALANAYADVGVKEYDRRNFKNAFECFKNAVKLAPTNQTASGYFWKMKNAGGTDSLKNEAGDVATAAAPSPMQAQGATAPVTAAGSASGTAAGSASGTVAGSASGPQAGVDSAAYKETQERLARTEQELANLKSTSGRTKEESDALKAALEEQRRKAESDLSAIQKAAAAASQENAAVKAELEKQRLAAARELEQVQKAAAAASQDSAVLKAELEKQRQEAARDLETMRQTAAAAAAATQESAAVKAELERQRQAAARDQEAMQKTAAAAAAAAQESAAVKAELERQKALSDKQREELAKTASSAKDDSQAIRSELGQYRVLVDQLNNRISSTDRTSRQDAKALADQIAAYQKSLENQGAASEENAKRLADELAAQKKALEEQRNALATRNLLLYGSVGVVVLLVAGFLFLFFRARSRRRNMWTTTVNPGYSALGLGADASPQPMVRLPGRDALLLEALPQEGGNADGNGGKSGIVELGMYRDLLKAERLKRMHDEMKRGALKWETVREYIGELDKDLRVDILRVVETKITEGEGVDTRAVMAVLLPFLTEHDDYLREKAESLVKNSLRGSGQGGSQRILAALPAPVVQDEGDTPLNTSNLLRITDDLRKLLKERDKSTSTAKIARGMGRKLGFSTADSDLLYKAALAHDAGYLLLDRDALQRILSKTVLSEEDFQLIRSHTKKGLEYFKGKKLPQEVKDAILYHHEANDGSGYPKGLVGAKIPPFAKIVGIAETFVALTSERPYREKLTPESAIAVIRDGAGRRYDREYVDVLAELVRSSGEAA